MNTKLTMTALLVSSILVLAALAAIPASNSVVFAGDHDGKHTDKDGNQKNHGCEKGGNAWEKSEGKCYRPG